MDGIVAGKVEEQILIKSRLKLRRMVFQKELEAKRQVMKAGRTGQVFCAE